jgi:phosphocarrier protein HPr
VIRLEEHFTGRSDFGIQRIFMKEAMATIKNSAGIHCRPTALITQEAAEVDSVITVIAPGGTCQLGSALDLMMLGLEPATEIVLQADGPDEEIAIETFRTLFETEFDFPQPGMDG